MKAGYIQYDVSHDKKRNLEQIAAALAQMDCGLAVLPELALCGYLFESRKALDAAAEPVPAGAATQAMLRLSEQYHCALVFGIAEKEGGRIYNTAVVADHGRYIGRYRKIHLSDFEKRYFDCGDENTVFDIRGCRIGVQICFDLWFPEISREQIAAGAQLLCVLGNFGGEHTYIIAQTRAIENLTPLVLCNRIGHEQTPELDADFLGKSSLIDRDGTRCSIGEAGCAAFAACTLHTGEVRSNVICRDFDAEIARHTCP